MVKWTLSQACEACVKAIHDYVYEEPVLVKFRCIADDQFSFGGDTVQSSMIAFNGAQISAETDVMSCSLV